MSLARWISFRMALAISCAVCLLPAGVLWLRWPSITVYRVAVAIEAQEKHRVRDLLGDDTAWSVEDGYRQIKGRKPTVFIEPYRRAIQQILVGEQHFLITGYGAGHHIVVKRGEVTSSDYVFRSGSVKYGTTR